MAANPNITQITPPRVPLVDAQTGLVSREWYRFFLSLFNLAGGGQNDTSLLDLQVAPRTLGHEDLTNINDIIYALSVRADQVALVEQLAELRKQVDALAVGPVFEQLAELQKQIDALSVAPVVLSGAAPLASGPVTKTTDFAVMAADLWIINNKAGSGCVVTLPSPISNLGRALYLQNYQAQTFTASAAVVVPLGGGAAATTILAAVAGAHATLVSDGTNWVTTQYL